MYTTKKMLSKLRKAIDDYKMIEKGDKIAIGVSGGKDSVTLLVLLAELQKFYPQEFTIHAISLDAGISPTDFSPLKDLCAKINIPLHVEQTVIGQIVYNSKHDKNPCSLCANLRRGALNNIAKELNCNKVALGHHKDDAIETLIMSLFYEGRINCFYPVTHLKKQNIEVIRPLIYIEEKNIKAYCNKINLPIIKNNCEFDGKTIRQSVKDMLNNLHDQNKYIKKNIFGAIKRSTIEGWDTKH